MSSEGSSLDNLDHFHGRNIIYARDDVRLSRRGMAALMDILERGIGDNDCFL